MYRYKGKEITKEMLAYRPILQVNAFVVKVISRLSRWIRKPGKTSIVTDHKQKFSFPAHAPRGAMP